MQEEMVMMMQWRAEWKKTTRVAKKQRTGIS